MNCYQQLLLLALLTEKMLKFHGTLGMINPSLPELEVKKLLLGLKATYA